MHLKLSISEVYKSIVFIVNRLKLIPAFNFSIQINRNYNNVDLTRSLRQEKSNKYVLRTIMKESFLKNLNIIISINLEQMDH